MRRRPQSKAVVGTGLIAAVEKRTGQLGSCGDWAAVLGEPSVSWFFLAHYYWAS